MDNLSYYNAGVSHTIPRIEHTMSNSKDLLNKCLFFTTTALARKLSVIAEDCFRPIGLNSSQGFALMCIVDQPGIQPSRIANYLALAPSSVTRIIELLERRGFVTHCSSGRTVEITATESGLEMYDQVKSAWGELYVRLKSALGDQGETLSDDIHNATQALDT